ncbi:MAG: alpha/beta fold hydrolase [Candidatus Levybacteria bacterium]|nr:alpha/beta fold hydrolase [Candidatus Levybacteria bacterium]
MKDVTIVTTNKQHIKGTLFLPEKLKEKNSAIILIHGWSSDRQGYTFRAEPLVSMDFICLTIDLRGHGESDGKLDEFSRADHLTDAIAAYDFLAMQKNVDVNNISVVGTSYGGNLAAMLADKRSVKNLILRAPALYTNKDMDTPTAKLIADRKEDFFTDMTPEETNVSLTGVKSIHGKFMIIESEKDQIIPHSIIEFYLRAAGENATHKIMIDADHQLSRGEWKREFIQILTKFFEKEK